MLLNLLNRVLLNMLFIDQEIKIVEKILLPTGGTCKSIKSKYSFKSFIVNTFTPLIMMKREMAAGQSLLLLDLIHCFFRKNPRRHENFYIKLIVVYYKPGPVRTKEKILWAARNIIEYRRCRTRI